MPTLITASQFVTAVLCSLKLRGDKELRLAGSSTDERFAKAYDDLLAHKAEFDVVPDFSLAVDPFHGDSETLRETLYAARQRGVVAINNPSFKTIELKLANQEAEKYLKNVPLPGDYIAKLIERYFPASVIPHEAETDVSEYVTD